ncbi:MAG: hypothetical protein V4507_10810 [Verrucomicrobiota bacterium]
MKYFPLILFIFPAVGSAQMPVTDAAAQAALQQSNAQRIVEHSEVINQWTSQIGKMNDQLTEAKKVVDMTTQMKNVMGDPSQITSLLNSDAIGSPGLGEVGKTFGELSKTVGNTTSLAQDVKGLYSPINFSDPSQMMNVDMSGHDPFAKMNAVENAFGNLSAELARSESEAKSIRSQIDTINKTSASTQAAQAQKQADLEALQGKLIDAQKRSNEAFQKLHAMEIMNETEKDRSDAAYIKAMSIEDEKKNQALDKLMGNKRTWGAGK